MAFGSQITLSLPNLYMALSVPSGPIVDKGKFT